MADIYFYQEEDPDDPDGGYGADGVDSSTTGLGSSPNPDDLLLPVQKLEKYADSENIFNRQIVSRQVLETLRAVVDDPADVDAVLAVMNKLADDVEPSVRAELMEQVPHVAMFCQEFKAQLAPAAVVPDHLLPMVVKFLTDSNNQVRKTSQAALLVLLEQGLVEKSDVQDQVCPVIIRLTEADSLDDYRTEAVALLSKMAPLIGREMVESLFLERFANLCVDPLFHVRKLCAANFGDFSSVVGSEPTEAVLLPKFFYLCEDGVWGVRKACADVFMPVSCVCSPAVRKSELSPLFVHLLRDQSRWVRMAAFQALGPFISTFADPSITALLHNDNGEIVITEPDTLAFRLEELEEQRRRDREEAEEEKKSEPEDEDANKPDGNETFKTVIPEARVAAEEKEPEPAKESPTEEQQETAREAEKKSEETAEDQEEDFNSFQFWREPLLPMEEVLTRSVEACKIKDEEEDGDKETEDSPEDGSSMELFRPQDASSPSEPGGGGGGNDDGGSSRDGDGEGSPSTFDPRYDTFTVEDANSSGTTGTTKSRDEYEVPLDPALPRGPPLTDQSIVPQLLIDHYVSMIDPSRAQTVDSEIARHCAFSLPAVALTLGRYNWPLLKDTYEALATDMQWKVRRTLASSIHELGVILGEEASGRDLIPVFNGFLKDLDEVRQGLLKHLADFLKLLGPESRTEYLPKLSEFLKMDNERNWRFRQELAEQLERLIPLFSPAEVEEHISPIAMVLVRDKVSAVRETITRVIAAIVLSLGRSDQPALATSLLKCVTESLAHESLWVNRQTFASLCLRLHGLGALDDRSFCDLVLPDLLDLAGDRVPNVRLAVARTLTGVVDASPYFRDGALNPHLDRLLEVEAALRQDRDVDVRYLYAGDEPEEDPPAGDCEEEDLTDLAAAGSRAAEEAGGDLESVGASAL